MEERGGRKEATQLLSSPEPAQTTATFAEPDKPDVRDISGTGSARKGATLISFDRLAEFERGEPARERRALVRPPWLREPDWLDRACRNPRIIAASRWVTVGSVIVGVLAIAWFVNATMLGARPVKGTPTISASPSKSAPARVRPSAIMPVEPKLPQPPPRTSLTPRKTRAKATTAPRPTRTREPSVAPSTPAPPTTVPPPSPTEKPTDIEVPPTPPGTKEPPPSDPKTP